MSVVVVGSLNIDYIMQVTDLPKRGETIFSQTFSQAPGGKGANQAAAASLLGADVTMVGCVGNDMAGKALKDSLAGYGVDVSLIKCDTEEPTGSAFITVDADGANTIVVHRGANFSLKPTDCTACGGIIDASKIVVMQLETPPETVAEALRISKECKATSILNPAPAANLDPALLSSADYLIPNETEATAMLKWMGLWDSLRLGNSDGLCDLGSALKAAALMSHATSNTVVITLGDKGCVAAGGPAGEGFALPAFPVKAVDTTAAGDAFVGAFACSLAEMLPKEAGSVEEALRFAQAAGALATTVAGAQPSLPRREQVEEFLRSSSGEGGRSQ